MQGLPLHTGGRCAAVRAIGHQWVADMRHVHADLVGAARVQAAAHQAANLSSGQ